MEWKEEIVLKMNMIPIIIGINSNNCYFKYLYITINLLIT